MSQKSPFISERLRDSGLLLASEDDAKNQGCHPWQTQLLGMLDTPPQNGSVHVVVGDSKVGKTTFMEYLMHFKKQEVAMIPPVCAPSDICDWCVERGPKKCYIIDFPTNAYKLRARKSFWEAISWVKKGHICHGGKEMKFDPPTIILFFGPNAQGLRNALEWGCDFHVLGVNNKTMLLQRRGIEETMVEWDASEREWKNT